MPTDLFIDNLHTAKAVRSGADEDPSATKESVNKRLARSLISTEHAGHEFALTVKPYLPEPCGAENVPPPYSSELVQKITQKRIRFRISSDLEIKLPANELCINDEVFTIEIGSSPKTIPVIGASASKAHTALMMNYILFRVGLGLVAIAPILWCVQMYAGNFEQAMTMAGAGAIGAAMMLIWGSGGRRNIDGCG